jgi:hypothetical protein
MSFASDESKGYTASMSRFRDTFDATWGNDEAARKHFDEVVKRRANAEADRGRKLFRAKTTEDVPVETRTDKRPKPVSE